MYNIADYTKGRRREIEGERKRLARERARRRACVAEWFFH